MKKTRRFMVLAVLLVSLFTMSGIAGLFSPGGALAETRAEGEAATPFYLHTMKINAVLSFSGNTANCSGLLKPSGSYSASITIKLYRQDGDTWTYITSWSGSSTGGNTATASGSTSVSSGTYKLVASGNVGGLEFPSTSTTKTKP